MDVPRRLTVKEILLMEKLVALGVFEVKNGSVILNFDKDGVLQSIDRKDSLYSKRHEG